MKRQALFILFSVNSFAAAMLALYIGFALGLPRPYWAMTTAYIVSQPLSGALRSKAVYRIIGTVVGAAAALALVPAFATSPELLSLALALWVGLCLYISLLDRTPRSYVFILAGYTAAIIGFPAAPEPATVFDVAVTRAEEIGLGVICATLTHSLFFPQAIGPVLHRRMRAWLHDAQQWGLAILAGQHPASNDRDRRRLAAEITEIRLMSTHLPFDTSNLREAGPLARAMEDRMSVLLPLVSAVGDRLLVLRADGAAPAELERLLTRLEAWLADLNAPRTEGEAILAGFQALGPPLGPGAPWGDLVLENLLDRLQQLVRNVQDIRDLRAAIQTGGRRLPATLDQGTPVRASARLHRDHYLAFLSALAASAATLFCCIFWIATGWPEGSVAALTAAVFCCFFATQDDPAPIIVTFLVYTLASIPIVAAYQFAVLPAIDGFPMLVLALAPVFLIAGYFIAKPTTSLRALAMVLGLGNGLALAENFSPTFAGFANSNIAQVIGLVAALVTTQLCRSVGAEWSARRILRAGWREIARVAEATRPVDRAGLMIRMLDRVGLLASRLNVSDEDIGPTAADALSDVRVSLNLQELQAAEARFAGGGGPARRLLTGVARGYRALARAPSALVVRAHRPKLDASLLDDLDQALAEAADGAPSNPQMRGAARALVSLRRTLFPDAPPYSAKEETA